MKTGKALMARVYLTEGERNLEQLLQRLRDREHIRGVTVYRGIAGFGPSGKMHRSGIIDLALDLPLVVEFFDLPEKIQSTIDHIREIVQPGHIVTWPVDVVEEGD